MVHVVEKVVHRERLLEERVGPGLLGVRHVLRERPLARHENGQPYEVRLAADMLAELVAGLSRQAEESMHAMSGFRALKWRTAVSKSSAVNT